MNQTKTAKRLLTVLIAAAAVSLAACGGGDSGGATSGDLPAGKVGTVGDGVNAAEFEAIKCGMNKDQVNAIVGDAPTEIVSDLIFTYTTANTFTSLLFSAGNGVLTYKQTGLPGKPASVKVNC